MAILCEDAGVASALAFEKVEFYFTGAAAGTKATPVGPSALCPDRLYLMVGDGAIDMTSAEADKLVKDANGTSLSATRVAASDQTSRSNVKTGLVNYFTNIPAAADAAKCLAFAIGGLGVDNIVRVELEWATVGTTAKNTFHRVVSNVASVDLGYSCTLGAASKLIKTGSTEIALGTDIIVTANGVAFGAIPIPDVLDVPGASEHITLRLWVRK